MKKTITYTAALLSVALFSGFASAASGEQDQDILHESGKVVSIPGTPYVRVDSGPRGTESDLLSNLHEVESSSRFIPYVQIEGDRDDRDNLIDQI